LKNEIRLVLGRRDDVVIFNNESGVASYGKHTVRYGVGKGGADLLGIALPTGRFVALEVKTGQARCTKQQRMFLELVRRFGGFAEVVRSVDDANDAIDRAREQQTISAT